MVADDFAKRNSAKAAARIRAAAAGNQDAGIPQCQLAQKFSCSRANRGAIRLGTDRRERAVVIKCNERVGGGKFPEGPHTLL